ncbi:MAG TPA: hypothetical protein VFO21_16580 [Vicinamibacterales bacterium]|nr:hypothetical protein [Vicinamibacterales bacterium]
MCVKSIDHVDACHILWTPESVVEDYDIGVVRERGPHRARSR